MKFRNLELARQIIKEASGLDISYAYDDLVFAEHGIFIIQYDYKDENRLYCYFQKDCTPSYRIDVEEKLQKAAKERDCKMIMRGNFRICPSEKNEEIQIEFVA